VVPNAAELAMTTDFHFKERCSQRGSARLRLKPAERDLEFSSYIFDPPSAAVCALVCACVCVRGSVFVESTRVCLVVFARVCECVWVLVFLWVGEFAGACLTFARVGLSMLLYTCIYQHYIYTYIRHRKPDEAVLGGWGRFVRLSVRAIAE